MTLQFNPKLKFMYVWDRQCPERVLTIGRYFQNDDLCVTWCMNKVIENPNSWVAAQTVVTVLDRFDKKLARHICSERFTNPEHVFIVPLQKDKRYSETILQYLCDARDPRIHRKVQRVAKNAISTPLVKQNDFYKQVKAMTTGALACYRRQVHFANDRELLLI